MTARLGELNKFDWDILHATYFPLQMEGMLNFLISYKITPTKHHHSTASHTGNYSNDICTRAIGFAYNEKIFMLRGGATAYGSLFVCLLPA